MPTSTGAASCGPGRPSGSAPRDGVAQTRAVIFHDELRELGRASGAHGEVVLRRRGAATELIVDGVFAMDDVDTSTERALATETLRRCPGTDLRVLVGGLGLGWKAATVLADPRVGVVDGGELPPPPVGWAGAGLLPGLPSLPAGRLRLHTADVADVLAAEPSTW